MQGMGSGQGFLTLLSRDEREALNALGLRRDYSPGATLCLEGDPATHVFVLLAGWVKILSTTTDGHEIVLALRGGGEIVGEIGGETGRRNATIQAVDTVRALIVPYGRFRSFLDTNLGADHAYRRFVTQRWNDADATLRSRTGTSGAQRLARLLLDLAERHGREVNGVIYVVMPLSQEELASLAGTSRATVTRAFASWRKRGLIRTAPRRITILDLKGLQKVAGQQR
jgi:CRP/FNR family transcriptional regulator, cyclic AMP receptor protein